MSLQIAQDAPFEKGDVVVWCDEYLLVHRAWESSGDVTYLDGTPYSNNFRWVFEGEATRRATPEELASIEQRWPHFLATSRARGH